MTDRLTVNTITSDALDALYDRAEQAEQARAEAEQRNADNWSRAEAAEARAERAEADRDRLAAELRAAEQRIEQHRRALADALAVHATAPWPQLIAHARAYVRHTDEWHALAVRRREHAERAEAERDRYRAAWQSARTRARRKHDDALANSATPTLSPSSCTGTGCTRSPSSSSGRSGTWPAVT